MIILVTDDRNWSDRLTMETALSFHRSKLELIINGKARGADRMSTLIARAWKIPYKEYPAEWDKHGRAAGPIRNCQMLDENYDVELVLAFHECIEKSKDTKHMIDYAIKRGKEVELWDGQKVTFLPETEGFFKI